MKFTVSMKDPDTLHDAIVDAVSETVRDMPEDEREAVMDCRIEKAEEICSKWFEWGEYLKVEIDTDAQTCIVVPKK